MRGIILFIIFFSSLPFIFISGPFWGILMWYWVALMNPQNVIWDSVFASIPFSFIVAVSTLLSWLLSQRESKFPPAEQNDRADRNSGNLDFGNIATWQWTA